MNSSPSRGFLFATKFSNQKTHIVKKQLQSSPGFTLVITISLLVLLTLVAVGVLSLSSITLRQSKYQNDMSVARSNARFALMLALGNLQKSAGPDQRITARADLLDEKISNPRITGVWKSRNPISVPPTSAQYSAAAKKDEFLGWMVSAANPSNAQDQEFAEKTPIDPIKLWDIGTLGTSAPDEDLISAGRVMVNSKNKGSFSWAIADEGIKARYNTPYDNTTANDGLKTAQLGSGERPGIEFIDGLSSLSRDNFELSSSGYETIQKGVTARNAQLAAETVSSSVTDALKEHTHDLTPFATGLFTDVTTGGFKEDFHLLSDDTALPSTYNGKGVYENRLGIRTGVGKSDPTWLSLHEFSRLYRQTATLTKVSSMPVLKATAPSRWTAATDVSIEEQPIVRPAAPAGVVLMPTIAKVQVVFTMLARDLYQGYAAGAVPVPEAAGQLHGPWGNNFKGTKYDYLLHMLYTPVVTLHNPYNVALEFNSLKVDFINVPFALRVYRNGVPQTTDLVPLDQMFYSGSEGGNRSKQFGMTMRTKDSAGRPGSTTFRLLPGEVKLFSPYIEPTRTWRDEHTSGSRIFFDYDGGSSDRAFLIDGVPGWRGDGIGFDLDWFCSSPFRVFGKEAVDVAGATGSLDRAGCIPLRAEDNLHFEFAPYSINKANSKFIVKMSAITPNSSARINTGAIELNYESTRGLQDFLLGKNGKMRYPKTGTVNTMSIMDHHTTAIKNYTKARPFAIVSAHAKSTYGGYDADKREGRHATKPWVFAHASIGSSTAKVISEHPANHSHELDLIFLEKNTDITDHLQIDSFDRGNFITGHTGQKGSKFGVMYDIPLAPIQSLASLNGANPGGSSGYLPRFAQPIGNSWASPMISADKFQETGGSAPLFDHSFMLNTALYDHFYFSGLATQSGRFTTGKTSADLIKAFSEGERKLLTDPRLVLHLPDGASPAEMATKLASSNKSRHTQVAAWQKMEGAFNVNSTSVSAWKAMLASIHASDSYYNKVTGATVSALTKLPEPSSAEVLISRLRLPVTTADDPGAYWLGPRVLNDSQLESLAQEIVKQVRNRGPFLSLSEFVNRQLVNGDQGKSGALQQAIDLSGINEDNTPEKMGQFNQFSGYQIENGKVAQYNYKNAAAGAGNSADGAPGSLTQADVLTVLGNAATVRSDTFTIRAYGDARDSNNKVLATAYCEAVVQRVPEYVDPQDPAYAVPQPIAPATTSSPVISRMTNQAFGRKFAIVSFRWLAKSEI